MPDDSKRFVLDRTVLVPVGVVMLTLGPVVAFTWRATVFFADFRDEICDQIQTLSWDIAELRKNVDASNRDRWTMHEQRSWAALLRAQNPELQVPPVD